MPRTAALPDQSQPTHTATRWRSAVAAICVATAPVAAQHVSCTTAPDWGTASSPSWSAWGQNLRNTRFASAAGTMRAAAIPTLRLAWAYSLGDVANARSHPAVVGQVLFVGSETGQVAALDIRTGCTYWTIKADAPIRSGLAVAPPQGQRDGTVFFGDVGGQVYALNARTGTRLWKIKADAHPMSVITGTPQPYRGAVYVPVSSYESVMPLQPGYVCCTFRGSVVALDAATGARQWQTFTIGDSARDIGRTSAGTMQRGPAGAAVWSTPTIDSVLDRVYFGTGNNYTDPASSGSDAIVALDRVSGRMLWSRQYGANDAYNSACDIPGASGCPKANGPDADFGQPPILVTLRNGKRALVAGQKSGHVHALDPDREGAPLWSARVDEGGKLGGPHWGSATDARTMYVAVGGEQMTGVADNTVKEGYRIVPDPAKGGGLHALDLSTGRTRWTAAAPVCGTRPKCSPAQSAAVTAVDGAVFSASLDGHLRAYETRTGRVIWDFDTSREFPTVNAGTARGGAIDVTGPVIVGSMLFMSSGYALWGGKSGNVLLAFTTDAAR